MPKDSNLTDKKGWRTVQCKVLDAEYIDDTSFDSLPDLEAGEDVTNAVLLTLQILDTNERVQRLMTGQELREYTKLSRDYTDRELMRFAEALRERDKPLLIQVPSKHDNVLKPEMFDDGIDEDEDEDEEEFQSRRKSEPEKQFIVVGGSVATPVQAVRPTRKAKPLRRKI